MHRPDPKLQKLLQYWHDLRGTRAAPQRAELQPNQFEYLLEQVFILERMPEGQIRYRLAGAALCESAGAELRGQSADILMDRTAKLGFLAQVDRALDVPATVFLFCETDSGAAAQMLLMPLTDRKGARALVFGALVTDDPSRPLRLRITAETVNHIAGSGQTFPMPDRDTPPKYAGMAEDPVPFRAPAPGLRSIEGNPNAADRDDDFDRPNLRLVKKG